MTFNTRCPACTTVFAVPPSALSASGGWVRCGRCSEVFDAASHRDNGLNPQFDEVADRLSRQMQIPLTPEAQTQPSLRPRRDGLSPGKPFSAPPVPTAPPSSAPLHPAPLFSDTVQKAAPEAPPELAPKRSSVERRRKAGGFDGSPRADRQAASTEVGSVLATAPVSEPAQAASARSENRRSRTPRTRTKTDRPSIDEEQEALQSALPLEDFSHSGVLPGEPSNSLFGSGYDAPTPAAAQLPPPSVATWVGSTLAIAVLTLLLGLQVLWTQRHELATLYPSLKPTMDTMCQRLQCKLMPLRQLDMVAIDNSVFRMVAPSEKGDRYQLSWVVTNQALVPVAAPALELTLHDVLDRPLLRKVILPADLGSPDLAVAAEGKWQASLNLNVLPPDGGVKVSGYRLIAFYP